MNTLPTGARKSYNHLLVESKTNENRIPIHIVSVERDDKLSTELSNRVYFLGEPKRRWAYRIEYTTPGFAGHMSAYYINYTSGNEAPDANLLGNLVGKDCVATRKHNDDIGYDTLTRIKEVVPAITKNLTKTNFGIVHSIIQAAQAQKATGRWQTTDLDEILNLDPTGKSWMWYILDDAGGTKAVCGARLAPLPRGQVGNLLEIRYFAGETMRDCGDIVTQVLHELSDKAIKLYVVFQYYNPFKKLIDYIQQHNRGFKEWDLPVGPQQEKRRVLVKIKQN